MGKLKVIVMLTSMLSIVLPSFVFAKSWNNDRRYICLTSQAAGYNAKHTNLELTDPETQYIIEPMVMTAKSPRQAKDGYFEVSISHSVKKVGSDRILALCPDADGKELGCFDWHSKTEPYNDLENAFISKSLVLTMYVGRKIDDPIFMTRINRLALYLRSAVIEDPIIEVGECNQF